MNKVVLFWTEFTGWIMKIELWF